MTTLFRATMTGLTILTGQQDSRIVEVDKECYDAEALLVTAPVNIDGKTYTWLVSIDGNTYVTLQDSTATNIKVPAATNGIIYNGILTAAKFFKLHASAPTSINVAFLLAKSYRE